MHVIRTADAKLLEVGDQPIFSGGQVQRLQLAGTDVQESGDFSCAVISFAAGARNALHRHSSDQILYVLAGSGKVGRRDSEQVISVGDCAIIPAQEVHWHGAADSGSPMSHLAIMRRDCTTEIVD